MKRTPTGDAPGAFVGAADEREPEGAEWYDEQSGAHWAMECGPGRANRVAHQVLIVLAHHADLSTGCATVPMDALVEESTYDMGVVARALSWLVAGGWVEVDFAAPASTYRLPGLMDPTGQLGHPAPAPAPAPAFRPVPPGGPKAWALQNGPGRHHRSGHGVLIVVADHAAPDGTSSRPSVDTIMECSGHSHSTVLRSLAWLEENGYIEEQVGRRGKDGKPIRGRGHSVIYRLPGLGVEGWQPRWRTYPPPVVQERPTEQGGWPGLTERTKWDVFARDGNRCVYCGTHRRLSVDHIVPRFKGGGDELDNLQTLCKNCNSRKGTRDDAEARERFQAARQ